MAEDGDSKYLLNISIAAYIFMTPSHRNRIHIRSEKKYVYFARTGEGKYNGIKEVPQITWTCYVHFEASVIDS
jgi:hypothetical protein